MLMDKVSSERLNTLRFPLIIGVVFIHAYETEIGLSGGAVGLSDTGYWVDFCRDLISEGIARIAVPLFFLMSGYFLFLGFSFSLKNYIAKVKSRFETLLVPFLFWNILTLCLIALAQFIPATQSFFSGKNDPILTFGLFDYLNAIFGFDRQPISYQFWFIRDLMVMVLMVPVVSFLLNTIPKAVLFALLSLWFLNASPIYIPSAAALLFFYAGAYFAHSNTNLFAIDRLGPFILFSYLLALLVDTSTKEYVFNDYVHRVGILLGICSALYITNAVVKTNNLKKALLSASSYSFFVFAAHEPLLRVIRKVSYKALEPSNDLLVLSLYFVLPIFVIVCSMFAYTVLKSIAPTFLNVISGGRNEVPSAGAQQPMVQGSTSDARFRRRDQALGGQS